MQALNENLIRDVVAEVLGRLNGAGPKVSPVRATTPENNGATRQVTTNTAALRGRFGVFADAHGSLCRRPGSLSAAQAQRRRRPAQDRGGRQDAGGEKRRGLGQTRIRRDQDRPAGPQNRQAANHQARARRGLAAPGCVAAATTASRWKNTRPSASSARSRPARIPFPR